MRIWELSLKLGLMFVWDPSDCCLSLPFFGIESKTLTLVLCVLLKSKFEINPSLQLKDDFRPPLLYL